MSREYQGALSGITVVEYGNFITAPFCGKLLADFGAEVIKIEPHNGGDTSRCYGPFPQDSCDPEKSGLFTYLNSNKLGITLNVESSKGIEILKELINRADCFIENLERKEIDRLGLTYSSLRELNKSLIVTSISLFGRTGPYKDYTGQHINCCALSGASHALGFPDREPISVPLFHYDYQAGLAAAAATITALIARQKIGQGQHIDISETDVAVNNIGVISLIYEVFLGITLKREGYRAPGSLGVYPCATYKCKDGSVTATSRNRKEWMRFIEAMGNPDWAKDARYQDPIAIRDYPEEVDRYLEPWLMEHTKEEILKIAQKYRIAITPIRTIDEVMREPHFKERKSFTSIKMRDGKKIQLPAVPYRLSGTSCRQPGNAPKIGEHNEEVYCHRLAYTKNDLVTLKRTGVI
jgi:crotonobetainyl-CoA:carnitine CoA-transferase CaiB-like acyl-CoA transferase